ncbi:fumarylacetoacetate hydrolase family protein [Streptomyces sp. NPDC002790]|uniref:2-keto-4-pentenoate hydratase n=1 Tax=Streptomyces sp. NPDC002790 TaxID=3154431 RepID=UPI0033181BDA
MSTWTTETVARDLFRAERERQDREPFTDEWADFSVAEAYATQDRLIELKQEAGEHVIGVKLGLTSRAKQQRMGISSPLTAWITDAMVLPQGAPVPVGELIHPRIEPEIVFVMGERLSGPGVTGATALAAVRSVHAGFEVIDSRYRDFRFQLPDVVADNASSARLLVNPEGLPPSELDLALEGCVLRVDGEVVDTATGAAVQGHPAEALALAANALAERGLAIEPGWLVLTGGITDAVPVRPGTHTQASFSKLGSVIAFGR